MASEQRLIDINRAIASMQKILDDNQGAQGTVAYLTFQAVIECLKQEPIVDAVVLPCKLGDEVWGIRRSNKGALAPHRGIVSHMHFAEDMKLCIVVQHICRGEWGKKVFATYEDACAAIRERREGE